MSVHVKNGTPLHGPSLCESCSNAHIEKGYGATEVLVLCDALYRDHRVLFPVRECSHYLDRNRQNLKAMEDIAWILDPGGTKRQAGFVHASELRNKNGEIELTLDDSD